MRKILFVTISVICGGFTLQAQNSYEALNYGLKESQGSARMISMGGAFTALGGDLASVMQNPAGLGIKRLDEFSVSLGFEARNRNTLFTRTNESVNQLTGNLNIPSLNYVITSDYGKRKTLRRFNVGLGYNRTQNLNHSFKASGKGIFPSFISSLARAATDNKFAPNFLQNYSTDKIAYESYMINYDTANSQYTPSSQVFGQRTEFEESVSGSMSEFYLNMSISLKDKLFLGANLSFPTITSVRKKYIYEGEYTQADSIDVKGTTVLYRNLVMENHLDIQGSAVKGSFGLLYRPSKYIRFGLAYHTPTSYTMRESEIRSGKSFFSNNDNAEYGFTANWEPYALTLPQEFNAGFAIVFGRKGLWSVDAHYIDLSKIQYSLPQNPNAFANLNKEIKEEFKEVFTIRTGFEYNVKRHTRLRAGFEFKTSGLRYDKLPASIMPSIGYGYAKEGFYVDLAYSLQMTGFVRNLYQNYHSSTAPIDAEVDTQNHRIVATVGWKLY
ncbi:MAG: outer membrane protein transport protein [Flavobacteriales bacterium]|jgi:long-subunit fatty acid transport protein|nr:outer membrane protein transport protein [Flavobacteriales bacterium]